MKESLQEAVQKALLEGFVNTNKYASNPDEYAQIDKKLVRMCKDRAGDFIAFADFFNEYSKDPSDMKYEDGICDDETYFAYSDLSDFAEGNDPYYDTGEFEDDTDRDLTDAEKDLVSYVKSNEDKISRLYVKLQNDHNGDGLFTIEDGDVEIVNNITDKIKAILPIDESVGVNSIKVEDYDFDKIAGLYNQSTTELEKAFTTEVKYWLQSFVDENSNDDVGKKASAILNDDKKIKEIVDELINGSDDLWEDIHMKIEHLAGIDIRRYDGRKDESKIIEDTTKDIVQIASVFNDEVFDGNVEMKNKLLNAFKKYAKTFENDKPAGDDHYFIEIDYNDLIKAYKEFGCSDEEAKKWADEDKQQSSKGELNESVDESKVNLYDTVWDVISSYDEEYAQEQGIDKLDDEDVYNIISEIISNPDVQSIIREEIESYAGYKNS